MMRIKIALLFILLLCIAVPAFGADTVHTYDSVHYDTIYLYDTTIAIQKQLTEMKSEFYDRAMQSIDDKRKTINKMLEIISVILIVISLVFAFMTYLMQRSRQAVDNEIKEIRVRRLAIDKVYDEIVSKEKRIKKLMSDIEERAEKPVAAAEKEAQEKSITSPEEKIKLIEEADAEQSIDEYKKLLFAMELEGVSKDKLPTSLHKKMGLTYAAVGQYEKALEFFARAAEVYPTDDMAYSNWGLTLGMLYDERKDESLLEEAVEKFKRAVGINDKNDNAYANWGTTLSRLYNERKEVSLLEEARERFKKAVEINDKNDFAYANWSGIISKLYDERKDVSLLEEAIDKCKKAVEINDKSALGHYNLGGNLLKKWRRKLDDTGIFDETLFKDARAHTLKALEIAPERKDRNFNLACTESLLENKAEMLKALKVAIEYDPKLKKDARDDVDFEKYWDDPDFIALTKED